MLSQAMKLLKRSAADTKGIGCGVLNNSETSGSMPNTSNDLATHLAELQARTARIETRLCQLMEFLGVQPHAKTNSYHQNRQHYSSRR
jgi:hypothetical protein